MNPLATLSYEPRIAPMAVAEWVSDLVRPIQQADTCVSLQPIAVRDERSTS
jgi:hypothetical protein